MSLQLGNSSSDRKDRIIQQQLDVIRTLTANNLRSMSTDFWGPAAKAPQNTAAALSKFQHILHRIGVGIRKIGYLSGILQLNQPGLLTGGNDNRRMRCNNKLNLRKTPVQHIKYFPLPFRMQMHIDFINQNNAFCIRGTAVFRIQKSQPKGHIHYHPQQGLISGA